MKSITRIELLSRKYIPKECPIQIQVEGVIRGVKRSATNGDTMYIDIPFAYEHWDIVDEMLVDLIDIFPDSLVYTLQNVRTSEKVIVIDWS